MQFVGDGKWSIVPSKPWGRCRMLRFLILCVRPPMHVCHVTLHDYVTHRYILMYGAMHRKLVKGTGIYRGGIPLGFPYTGSSIAQAWKFIIRS